MSLANLLQSRKCISGKARLIYRACNWVITIVTFRSLFEAVMSRWTKASGGTKIVSQFAPVKVPGALFRTRLMNRRNFLQQSGAALTTSLLVGPAVSPAAVTSAELADLVSVYDVENRARQTMGEALYDYVASGAADEITVRWNIEKYRELRLRPRVLRDVSHLDPTVTLLGQRLTMPVLLAPTANHGLIHPEGEIATARGADHAGVAMVLSSGANTEIAQVRDATRQPLWFQLYMHPDRAVTKDIVQHAEAGGAGALCVTVDSPVDGARNREKRARITLGPGLGHPNYFSPERRRSIQTLDEVRPQKLDWAEIEWLRSIATTPMLLKGILTPEDAERAVASGASGIVVSNHGGRVLDTVPATIEALPAVVQVVAGRVPVLVDGGIRRGTDVLKAVACGATAVLIGRPYVYGLALKGSEGVAHVLKTMRLEFLQAMALTGCPNIESINRQVLW